MASPNVRSTTTQLSVTPGDKQVAFFPIRGRLRLRAAGAVLPDGNRVLHRRNVPPMVSPWRGFRPGDATGGCGGSCAAEAALARPPRHPLCIPTGAKPQAVAARPQSRDVSVPNPQSLIPNPPIPMHLAQPAVLSPKQLLQLLRVHVKLWLLPAVAIAAVVGVYAVVPPSHLGSLAGADRPQRGVGRRAGAGQVQLPRGNEDRPRDHPRSGQEPQRARRGAPRGRAAGRLPRPGRLAHRTRRRRGPQERQTRSPQGRRVRQDRGLLSRRAGGRPRPLGGAQRGRLQTASRPIPRTPRRQGAEHDRRVDQDRPPGRDRSGPGHGRSGGDRESRGQRPGRVAVDARHGLQRQRPAAQRRGNPRATPRERR